ncbi:unnamed protein product [Polarella glacialis]|uniref:Pseudouridine synthase RsuA/RluA-like domain-containing protein n=1 Tax=Polarella glacialis TaxID=89957 RepID=A0A813DWQ2_POLGL|nr:unnamed protein product [Polarella glacialis]
MDVTAAAAFCGTYLTCSASKPHSTSERTLPCCRAATQPSSSKDLLLELGAAPSHEELREALNSELGLLRRSPKHATFLLSALAKSGRPQAALNVLSFMLTCQVEVNAFHANVAISACQKVGEWQLALGLLSSLPGMRVTPDKIGISTAMSACEKEGQWHFAWSLLRDMPEKRVTPDQVSYNAAISACSKGGKWELALDLLADMRDRGVMPNDISFNAAITACDKPANWQLALSLLMIRRMPDSNNNNNSNSNNNNNDIIGYNAAISTCARAGSWQAALCLLSAMREMALMPNVISYSAAISACEKGSQWKVALQILGHMFETRVPPNEISWNAAVSACGDKGAQWQAALNLLTAMPDMRTAPSEVTYNAAINACRQDGQWQLALCLLTSMMHKASLKASTISYSAAISAVGEAHQWQLALSLLTSMPEKRLQPNVITYNAALSALMADGCWQLAVALLTRSMPDASITPNQISYSATLSACEKGNQWQVALMLLNSMPKIKLGRDRIVYNSAISACEKAGQWILALNLLSSTLKEHGVAGSEISYNAAISACDKGGQWQLAVSLLCEMTELRLPPGEISYNAAISACSKGGQTRRGLELLWECKERGLAQSLSFVPWALARLGVSDPEVIDAALSDAIAKLADASNHSPRELSTVAWATAMLGVSRPELSSALAKQAIVQIHNFKVEELLLAAWGAAGAAAPALLPEHPEHPEQQPQQQPEVELLGVIQAELASRLDGVASACETSHSGLVSEKMVEGTLGVIWACNFAGLLSEGLLESARRVMKQAGKAMDDASVSSGRRSASKSLLGTPTAYVQQQQQQQHQQQLQSGPEIVLDLPDRMVVFKPPGWEVADQHTELQLLSYLQALLGNQCPILGDATHGNGFLHRLDVPCSGLILAAKTYEAYYDLKVQLTAGEIARDYVVLCHGWVPPCRKQITARVAWREELPTTWSQEERVTVTASGAQGKHARTHLKVAAHTTLDGRTGLSLVALRIATGRRHQIRSHLAHIGHPTAGDGKYTAEATFQTDLQALCERLWLHRYRLAFQDAAGLACEVMVPVPADLKDSLEKLRGDQWQLALLLLSCMSAVRATPNEISYKAAINSCYKGGHVERGVELLRECKRRGIAQSLSCVPWAMAKLGVSDPVAIDEAFAEAFSRLRGSTTSASPQELSLVAWAAAMLGVTNVEFSRALVRQALAQIHAFKVEELLLVAWGAAASGLDAELFRVIQAELGTRLEEVDLGKCYGSCAFEKLVEGTLGVIWSCNFAGLLSEELLESARRVMRQVGKARDDASSGSASKSLLGNITACAQQQQQPQQQQQQQQQSEPEIVLDLPDRMVVFKPPGWEVADQHTELQLLSYLQALLGNQCPILGDATHGNGFLHRLDVPCSGLILAAKTYEAYYNLQLQLRAGEIARDYVVLCHGWVPPCRAEVSARVDWRREEVPVVGARGSGSRQKITTTAGSQGKPARTYLKVLAHASHDASALSLIAMRIATGRRHQIRSHLSHVGHPTGCDGKYAAETTFQSDLSLCGRLCLHRYRLAFQDASGLTQEALAPVPADLTECLQKLTARSLKQSNQSDCSVFWCCCCCCC